jgi:hypothetical protein
VAVRVQGLSRELRGDFTITGDPNENLSAMARAARQKAVDDLYALQKSLDTARRAVRMLDQSSPEASDRPRIEAELNRLVGITGGLMRAVEGFPSAPTADQRQQIQWATEDATRVIAAVNRLGRR